jgi:hypothetical protein
MSFSPIIKQGAMAPLVHDSRTEVAVVFFCRDWEELPFLLESPLEYLRTQQYLWSQDSRRAVGWQMLTPITATIEYGFKDIITITEVFSLLGDQIFGDKIDDMIDTSSSAFTTGYMTEKMLHDANTYLEGSFLVFFSIYTNALRILYFPPKLASVEAADQARGGPRFKGHIMEPSLISAQISVFSSFNLHFDLKETSHRMRADFIVGELENPWITAKSLTEMASLGHISHQKLNMVGAVPARQAFIVPRVAPMPTQTVFIPGFGSTALGIAGLGEKLGHFMADKSIYGTIVAHNLSDPMMLVVCGTRICAPIPQSQSTHLQIGMGTMIVESYARILYDPKVVLDRLKT